MENMEKLNKIEEEMRVRKILSNPMTTFNCVILEVTRRCNLRCAHCLRGEAESIDMSKETINKVIDLIAESNSFVSVSFTGGEPTLRNDLISYFFEQMKERELEFSSFWLATNGYDQKGLLPILASAYTDAEDKNCCGVALSVDKFHEDSGENLLKCFTFYDSSKEVDWKKAELIDKGMANFNGLGGCVMDEYLPHFTVNEGDINDCDIYVSANGLVTDLCDLSFEEIDESGISLTQFREYLLSGTEDFQDFLDDQGLLRNEGA